MSVVSVRGRPPAQLLGRLLAGAALASALVAVGVVSASEPWVVVLGVLATVVVTVCFIHPPAAAYLVLASAPLLAGMDRGTIVPVLRPNEAVAVLLGGTVLVRHLSRNDGLRLPERRLHTGEASLLLLIAAGSVLPLLTMALRGRPITELDVFYALVLWKCLGVYLIVRGTIRTDEQVRRCLVVAMAAAAVAATIGILQSRQVLGVPGFIARFFAPEGYASEDATYWGTSTVGHAQAMGDVMAFSAAIALAWIARRMPHRGLVVAFIGLFVLGAVTTGEFSSAIAVTVAVGTAAVVTRSVRRTVVVLLPFVVVAAIVLQPVIQSRLGEFSSPEGVPPSWTGRLDNLTTYVIPRLETDFNYALGVQPAARVTKSTDPYRFGYIESGHLWFLWTGGIPFLLAFVCFLVANLRLTRRIARHRRDAMGVAAVASFAALTVVAVMTLLDPHLTFRGSAELNFSLLGLAHLGLRPSAAGSAAEDGTAASVAAGHGVDR
jgi:hypothetical protein